MPGEPKPQLPQRIEGGENDIGSHVNSNSDHNNVDNNDVDSHNQSSDVETESCTNSSLAPWELVDVSQWETDMDRSVDLSSIKQEPIEDSDYEEEDRKPPQPREYSSPFVPGDLELALAMHRPKIIPVIKKEKDCEENSLSSSLGEESNDLFLADKPKQMKPVSPKRMDSGSAARRTVTNSKNNSDCLIIPPDNIKKEPERVPSANVYQTLRFLHPKPLSRNSIPVVVKKEPLEEETPKEQPICGLNDASSSNKEVPNEHVCESLRIKSELIDKGKIAFFLLRYLFLLDYWSNLVKISGIFQHLFNFTTRK